MTSTEISDGIIGYNSPFTVLPDPQIAAKIASSYKLASREYKPENSTVKIRDGVVFGKGSILIGGPCSVETEEQLAATVKGVKKCGAHMFRGGAFKPRTSPYSFQGLGIEGLKLMKKVSEEFNIPFVSEIMSEQHLPDFDRYVDMIQIGSRNMQNFDLLIKVAKLGKPILLKRGLSATLEEFLCAAEYILAAGNDQLVLCERGIRTYEQSTRNILDLNSLTLVKELSHIPIIADPSHAAGRSDIILPLSMGALAAGADGLMVEVHFRPEDALCDGRQSLTLGQFDELCKSIALRK